MRLSNRRILSCDLFDTPDLVDTLTARMEKDLLLKAWDQGWLPARTTWSFWMERPEFSSWWLPMAEVSMTVTERRERLACSDEPHCEHCGCDPEVTP